MTSDRLISFPEPRGMHVTARPSSLPAPGREVGARATTEPAAYPRISGSPSEDRLMRFSWRSAKKGRTAGEAVPEIATETDGRVMFARDDFETIRH